MNNDLLCVTLSGINQEQLEVLTAAVQLVGFNFEILYQKGILSEDYVAAYGDFFKELGNELTRADDLFIKPARDDSRLAFYEIDCVVLPCGGYLDMEGGAADEK